MGEHTGVEGSRLLGKAIAGHQRSAGRMATFLAALFPQGEIPGYTKQQAIQKLVWAALSGTALGAAIAVALKTVGL
jgi:hypothetical protein